MLYEKKKLLIHKIIWALIFLSVIVITVVLAFSGNFMAAFLLCYVDIIIFALFIGVLLLSCKVYAFEGKEIIVYAGWYHHYIKVDGVKIDEHNTLISFTAITLSGILDDGTDIKATISLTYRISLKINNKLYSNRK